MGTWVGRVVAIIFRASFLCISCQHFFLGVCLWCPYYPVMLCYKFGVMSNIQIWEKYRSHSHVMFSLLRPHILLLFIPHWLYLQNEFRIDITYQLNCYYNPSTVCILDVTSKDVVNITTQDDQRKKLVCINTMIFKATTFIQLSAVWIFSRSRTCPNIWKILW